MLSKAALNIFMEYQPITACWGEGSERSYLYGLASITELPYMKLQFPQSSLYDGKQMKLQLAVEVYYEIDHSYLVLYTRVVRQVGQKSLLVRIEHHEHNKQKRAVSRIPASGVLAQYLPMDDQGNPLRSEKKQGEAVNISRTGILLRTDEIFEPDQRLALSLTFPDAQRVHCYGRVVRLALHRTGIIESAIHFEDMTKDNRTMLGDSLIKISE